ncbi:MAG: hypothetical protein LUE29_11255 [Lachnospiraceae bacterium]|nr:hypothetical protein [Lachnospiraceae bacterium]
MTKLKQYMENFVKDESGMGVIEVVLIIVILVGLAVIFKTQITSILNSIFTSLKSTISSF